MNIKLAFTREEAATACGVSLRTIIRAINTGALKAKRSSRDDDGNPTGKYLILADDLRAWLDSLEAA